MDHRSDLVIEINRQSVFSLEEAQGLLQVIFRITKAYCQKVEALLARLDTLPASQQDLSLSLEAQVNSHIQDWQTKVQKLGALPKGLWIADFDSGDGYYCWKYPERKIEFWHKYTDGFSKRLRVSDRSEPIPIREGLRKDPRAPISLRPPQLLE